jgi:catechol 2,3-dioxygenase-like lactoylglutathione lyase family enzyme
MLYVEARFSNLTRRAAAPLRAPGTPEEPNMIDMKLEVVILPVKDVERAKRFYAGLGWRADADIAVGDDFRVVQFTPPGSPCSIHFGRGLTSALPGSVQRTYLVVSDIEAARAELLGRAVDVSEVFHRLGRDSHVSGAEPKHQSYASFASFSDPDGNTWLLQEVTVRLPGRVAEANAAFGSAAELANALRRAAAAHGEHEKRSGGQRDENWPEWYADYLFREQAGKPLPT